ncbi:VanW family protein [Vampirovibrio chlorellavorus]|uniref:VanW family protein n=1 Tax=Vampirovibrio chlorellavorus TaxID=758823 RepID=UPI0026EA96B5|nr:VanW family protein [Vampirovibrio chlorellavorus]
MPITLLALCWWGNPFAQPVAQQQLSVQSLSPAQKNNLRTAIRHLNGVIIPAGQSFSFNRSVGPRTKARGYQAAPSYLGGESPSTVGGGICLLSSALYQLALKANLPIEQRVPHLRTIHSVPPGLDATVWYGGADLKFKNNQPQALRIAVTENGNTLSLAFQGKQVMQSARILRTTRQPNQHSVLVSVFRNDRMISRDWYRLTP